MKRNGCDSFMDQDVPLKQRLVSTDSDCSSVTSELAARMNGLNGHSNGHTEAEEEKVAILDFGAQYGKVIDRRVREHNVLSEMFPLATTAKQIKQKGNFKAIIISGGPNSVYAEGAPQVDPEIFTCGLPVLGICYGFQLLNKAFGGGVSREKVREDGQCHIDIDNNCPLFKGLADKEKVLLTHGDSVSDATVAVGFDVVARSHHHVAGIACAEKRLYGVQFHPEVDLTTHSREIFDNFLFNIAGCTGGYTMENREQMCIDEIRQIVGDKQKVLVMVSGGVDSTVCAALLHKALGAERVTAIHIDNGFMRHEESDRVIHSLNDIHLGVHRYNCWQEFQCGTISGDPADGPMLDHSVEPERKRQIIGNTFIRVKDEIMDQLKLDKNEYFLAQGTLRPDLIESASALASGHADTIKTHHNDTALVRELRALGRVIEPLRDFHKDEVRELGQSLGLPEALVQRQPFPGPGLAIRILCAEKPFKCDDFSSTHSALSLIANWSETKRRLAAGQCEESEAEQARGLLALLEGQDGSFGEGARMAATLLPIKSVGVQGDSRSYSYVAAFSTEERPIPWARLERLATLVPKVLHNINRVVYVFGGEVKQSCESITVTHLNQTTVQKLQKADKLATDALFGLSVDGSPDPTLKDVSKAIQQMPVVMLPVHLDRSRESNSYKHSFCLRPFITQDFMTGVAALPGRDIPEQTVLAMAERIDAHVLGTSRVMLDLTSKPPGTTEWE